MSDEQDYYLHQAGTGLAYHSGVRHQKGYSFWGRLLEFVNPIVGFFGKTALSTGADIAQDIVDDKDWKESVKSRLSEAGKNIVKQGIDKTRDYAMKGLGRKRKKRVKSKSTRRKKVKKTSKDLIF